MAFDDLQCSSVCLFKIHCGSKNQPFDCVQLKTVVIVFLRLRYAHQFSIEFAMTFEVPDVTASHAKIHYEIGIQSRSSWAYFGGGTYFRYGPMWPMNRRYTDCLENVSAAWCCRAIDHNATNTAEWIALQTPGVSSSGE